MIWEQKNSSLKSGEFEPFSHGKSFVYKSKSYFSGRNLVKFCPPQNKKHLVQHGCQCCLFVFFFFFWVQTVVQMGFAFRTATRTKAFYFYLFFKKHSPIKARVFLDCGFTRLLAPRNCQTPII